MLIIVTISSHFFAFNFQKTEILIGKIFWKKILIIITFFIFEDFLSHCLFDIWGGAFPFTVGRIEHGYNVRPDLCATDCTQNPRQYLGQVYTDSLVHDAAALRLLVDVMGEVTIINVIISIGESRN